MNVVLVITNLPNREAAIRLAEELVGARAAACVNVLAPCRSIYHWRGKTESAEEIPLMIKTTEEHYAEVEQLILTNHPYELPEIIRVPVTGGLPQYLKWITNETQ